MSRVGKKEIIIPSGVKIDFNKDTMLFTANGPLGQLQVSLLSFVDLTISDEKIIVSVQNYKEKLQRSMWGTSRALIQNAISGVSKPFSKELELNGVGFKMALNGNNLVLNIGFSHPVNIAVPSGIKLSINKNLLQGESIDKQLIGNFFTTIHNMKPADPYKHKGFKFPGRFYKKKVGKKAK
jgi:large subunit ribosomal protein L6